jgi:hypothetical protein
MNNPQRILETLDRHLTAPAELILFGRAALALGYPGGPATFAATRDVDAILPLSWLDPEIRTWISGTINNAKLDEISIALGATKSA